MSEERQRVSSFVTRSVLWREDGKRVDVAVVSCQIWARPLDERSLLKLFVKNCEFSKMSKMNKPGVDLILVFGRCLGPLSYLRESPRYRAQTGASSLQRVHDKMCWPLKDMFLPHELHVAHGHERPTVDTDHTTQLSLFIRDAVVPTH